MNAQQVLEEMIRLAREHPGQPVALVSDGQREMCGLMALFPYDEDWYYEPVPLSALTQAGDSVESPVSHKMASPVT